MSLRDSEDNDTTNFILKLLSIVVLLGMGMGFGVMPYFITSFRKNTKILGIANAFSGGLFLGIGLFHILPEAAERLENLTEAPIAYFFAFVSYAVILFVEKIAFNSHSLVHHHEHELEQIPKTDEEEEHKHHEDEHKDEDEQNSKKSGITPYILLLALGFHGLFEGMALGIQSEIGGTLFLLLAIAAHKWAASLTLGISFVKAKVSKKQLIIMILIFALIGPVGIVFGLILSSTASENVEGIFLAISTGTFLYISCSEVIIEEFADPTNKYIKFLMFLLGGIFTAGLSLMELIGPDEGGDGKSKSYFGFKIKSK